MAFLPSRNLDQLFLQEKREEGEKEENEKEKKKKKVAGHDGTRL